MTLKEKKLLNLLNDEWHKLKIAMNEFEKSLNKCIKIGIKNDYTFEETEAFDALSTKFARNSDILFQKIFKTIIELSGEKAATFLDKVQLLEKMNVIENIDILKEIREFRNQIVHEYFIEQIISLYPDLIDYSKKLIDTFHQTEKFLLQKNWINQPN